MKKIIIVFLMAEFFTLSVFGQWSDIDMQVTRATINVMLTQIDGRLPLPQGSIQTSPGRYIARGTGLGGTERFVVFVTNNFLGVVSVAVTETGGGAERNFNLHREVVDRYFTLQNAVSDINSLRGTLVRDGRRYRFAMDYHPHNQQLVIVVTRQ